MTFEAGDPQQQYPYMSPTADQAETPRTVAGPRQSGMGIASFVIAIVAGVAGFALIVVAGFIEASTPGGMDEESPVAIVVGLGIFGIIALGLLGLGLGVGGLVQPNRSKIFAVLGLLFNLLLLLGLGGLMVVGLAMEA